MKTILLDVDDVICISGYLDAINEFLGSNYNIDDFESYYIEKEVLTPNQLDDFYKFVENRNFYKNPTFIPGAIETIKKLSKKYEIFICSSYVNYANHDRAGRELTEKYNFLIESLPFLNPENFIFATNKNMFKADIRIDDKKSNLKGDGEIKILFPAHHNLMFTKQCLDKYNIIRAGRDYKKGWSEIEKLLLK